MEGDTSAAPGFEPGLMSYNIGMRYFVLDKVPAVYCRAKFSKLVDTRRLIMRLLHALPLMPQLKSQDSLTMVVGKSPLVQHG